jgi:hypothetical protein
MEPLWIVELKNSTKTTTGGIVQLSLKKAYYTPMDVYKM